MLAHGAHAILPGQRTDLTADADPGRVPGSSESLAWEVGSGPDHGIPLLIFSHTPPQTQPLFVECGNLGS